MRRVAIVAATVLLSACASSLAAPQAQVDPGVTGAAASSAATPSTKPSPAGATSVARPASADEPVDKSPGAIPIAPAPPAPAPDIPVTAAKKNAPNVVVIVTDDQRDGTVGQMANVTRLLQRQGVDFVDAQSPTSTCCPARASLYTGNLASTTGVWTNWAPYGGWEAFHAHGNETASLAVRMHNAGYVTALSGKYLNGYAYPAARVAQTGERDYIPPGWDNWYAFGMPEDGSVTEDQGYFGYYLMQRPAGAASPEYVKYGSRAHDYSTDVFGRLAVHTIEDTPKDKPLFMVYAPFGPHSPYVPAPRDAHARVTWPSVPGMDMTAGKPSWVQLNKRVTERRSSTLARKQARTLLSVDDNVGKIMAALQDSGRLDNTLVVFLSDNGLTWGEFNIIGEKNYPYTTDIPLIMRWDQAPAGSALAAQGSTDERLASITDVTTTILKAAGASTTGVLDGMDLGSAANVRKDLLISAWRNRGKLGPDMMQAYCGLRTPLWLYVRYNRGFEELYHLVDDPNMLTNLATKPQYAKVMRGLHDRAKAECTPAPPGYKWSWATTGAAS